MARGKLYFFTRLRPVRGPAQAVQLQAQELERFLRMMNGEAEIHEN